MDKSYASWKHKSRCQIQRRIPQHARTLVLKTAISTSSSISVQMVSKWCAINVAQIQFVPRAWMVKLSAERSVLCSNATQCTATYAVPESHEDTIWTRWLIRFPHAFESGCAPAVDGSLRESQGNDGPLQATCMRNVFPELTTWEPFVCSSCQ